MAKLLIEGEEYPMPDLSDANLEQARIIKRYTGASLEEVADLHASDPDLIAALCHLAIHEREPALKFGEIEEQVGRIKLAKISSAEEVADEASPPPSGQNATESEPNGSGESSATTLDAAPATIPTSIGVAR
jgi:hypothetical protein